MTEEKEIKIRVLDEVNINELKQLLENIFKIKFDNGKKDEDVYYDLKDNFYFNLNHGLRIRNKKEIAYKALFYIPERTINPWFVLEKEYQLPISKKLLLDLFSVAGIEYTSNLDDDITIKDLKNIFHELNLSEHIKINKVRYKGKNDKYEICIDLVEDLGLFVEIEATNDNLLNYFRENITFNYKEIRHGYTNLYAKEVLNIDIPNFKERFLNNSNWNFLNKQKEIVKNILKENQMK